MNVWVAIGAAGVLGLAVWGAEQNPAQPPKPTVEQADENTRITVDVTRVNMLFTVTDKKGRFVTDLNKSDFEVIETKRVQPIMEFSAESDLPLRLAVLIDTSNSIRDRFRFEQEAAAEFLKSVVKSTQDKAMVVSFDTSPDLVSDLIDDTDKLERAIRDLRPGGGTALFDAIYFACKDKLQQDQPKHKFRRAVVILSDGEDNQSRVTREEAIEMAQRAEVVIYTISTNVSGVKLKGDKVLERMADATGGRAFFPFKIEDVANAFSEIQDELRSQYLLAYKPADFVSDGKYRSIDIIAESHKNLRVRVRKGYYAPRAQ